MRKMFFLVTFFVCGVCAGVFAQEQSFVAADRVEAWEVRCVRSFGDTLFSNITGIRFLPNGLPVVCDKDEFAVKLLSRGGKLLKKVGKRGKGAGEFRHGPFSLAVGASKIAVVDFATTDVLFFDHSLQFLAKRKVSFMPLGVRYDSQNNLWVGTFNESKPEKSALIKYDDDGKEVGSIELQHKTDVMWETIFGFASTKGDTFVVAYRCQNVLELHTPGQGYLGSYRLPWFPQRPQCFALDDTTDLISSSMKFPEGGILRGIAVDENGLIYLVGGDYTISPDRDVYVCTFDGRLVAMFELPVPTLHIGFDPLGYLWSIELNGTCLSQYEIIRPKGKKYGK